MQSPRIKIKNEDLVTCLSPADIPLTYSAALIDTNEWVNKTK